MAARQQANKDVAKASVTTAPAAETQPPADTQVGAPESDPEVALPPPGADEPPAADKPKKASKTADRPTFVLAILSKHLPIEAAEAWLPKVEEAIDGDRMVTITNVDGSPVLEIHAQQIYNENAAGNLAETLGEAFLADVNKLVLAKFPKQ